MLFHLHSVQFCSSSFQPQRFQADQVGFKPKTKQNNKQKNKQTKQEDDELKYRAHFEDHYLHPISVCIWSYQCY